MRSVAALWCACCTILLAGCWSGRALYSFEPPFWGTLGDESRARLTMAALSLAHGFLPGFQIEPDPDPLAALNGRLRGRGYAVAIVGPLLSLQWMDFVPQFPKTAFVLIDAPLPQEGGPAHTVFLTFDRTQAFREAGRDAGRAARATGSGKVGVLTCEGSDLRPAEVDAFVRGAAEANGGLVAQEIGLAAQPDADAIRGAVRTMRSGGVTVFLLGLGDRNPAGLEALRDLGGSAVVADWQASGMLPQVVLASVEEDVPGGISRALGALGTATAAVEGPVRVARGKRFDKG